MSATADRELAELRRANAELLRERDAALTALALGNTDYGERIEQQAATIEVLKAMSASSGNPQPVFDLIVERARTCCGAELAAMTLLDGELLQLQAMSSMTAAKAQQFAKAYPLHVSQAFAGGRAILMRDTVQVPDTQLDPGFAHRGTNAWHRSILAVPLLHIGAPIGAIGLGRSTPGTFSRAQVELLNTFAEQAVIAITSAETYRALQGRTSDLEQALEQQTATAEVLQVINASPGKLGPVFEVILDKAMQLCQADFGAIGTFDGERGKTVATRGIPAAYADYLMRNPVSPHSGTAVGRIVRGESIVHIQDLMAEAAYRSGHPDRRAMVELVPVHRHYDSLVGYG